MRRIWFMITTNRAAVAWVAALFLALLIGVLWKGDHPKRQELFSHPSWAPAGWVCSPNIGMYAGENCYPPASGSSNAQQAITVRKQ
jgi:hypothetical protein